MSEEIQARIFDPFFSTERTGRGMGLAAVQGIIQSHGGTIKVDSAVGSGSGFDIMLPCVRQGEQRAREVALSSRLSGGENVIATVLIIDGKDALRLPVAGMLRRKGFSILEAGDGATGIEPFQARATQIDIVLLDLTLPGMSGGEILAALRKIRSNIKVIVSTAYSRDRALAAVGDPKSVLLSQETLSNSGTHRIASSSIAGRGSAARQCKLNRKAFNLGIVFLDIVPETYDRLPFASMPLSSVISQLSCG